MRKLSFLLLSAAMLFSLVGCGKDVSATSDSSSSTTNEVVMESSKGETEVIETTEEEIQQLNNEASEDETETQEPEEIVPESEAPVFVNWEDYLDGNTWDLTAYAEALGYTWIPDPEYDGLVMYMIEHDGSRYYFTYMQGVFAVFCGDAQGRCWSTSSIGIASEHDYVVKSNGQEDQEIYVGALRNMVDAIEFIASDEVDLKLIPNFAYTLYLSDGEASYYSNGMIRQREFGENIQVEQCNNSK